MILWAIGIIKTYNWVSNMILNKVGMVYPEL